jgi:hypothetical protein
MVAANCAGLGLDWDRSAMYAIETQRHLTDRSKVDFEAIKQLLKKVAGAR